MEEFAFFQHLGLLFEQLLLAIEILHLLDADALVPASALVEGIAAALHL